MNKITIYKGNCLETLKKIEDESINTCITSPPYFGLRDYGVDGQFGLENTIDEFINNLVNVFKEVKRVLRSDRSTSLARTAWPHKEVGVSDSLGINGVTQGAHDVVLPHQFIELLGTPAASDYLICFIHRSALKKLARSASGKGLFHKLTTSFWSMLKVLNTPYN